MKFTTLLVAAALSLTIHSASAADQSNLAQPKISAIHAGDTFGPVIIFDNIARKYHKSLYLCCDPFFIDGPTSGGHMLWDAEAFTPASNHTITKIQVAAGYGGGTNEIVVALYADNGGVPGTVIKSWRRKNLPPAYSCCDLVSFIVSPGIPVTGGTKYWLVLKTDNTNKDAAIAWNANTTDQISGMEFAQYCSNDLGGPTCATTNDQWTATGIVKPGLAFAIIGN
ncbi:MAG TPA: choice-of-anchor R domain-containing protein [Rhizomicrobium sp.]|nr:choice-of-anchor R domain-containing protein [Rhizomicrobium sp.]